MKRTRLAAAALAAAIAFSVVPGAVKPPGAYAAWTGTIESSVSFRTGPSTSDSRIRYLKKGERVRILEQVNKYWYKAEDSTGTIGYVSSNAKYITVTGAPAAPSAPNTGVIVSSVSFRKGPGTSYDRIRYLAKGETVEILGKVNQYWYHVRDAKGIDGYVSTNEKYINANYTPPAAAPAPKPETPAGSNTGVIVSSVSLREGPGTSYKRIRYVSKGETVEILNMVNEYWYHVRDQYGNTGYLSANEKYINANYTPPVFEPEVAAELAQRVIEAGLKYLGTPYEYGSDRSTTDTFDCSDFVRTAFLEGAGIYLPSNSRTQGEYVKNIGRISTDWRTLKPGDILFFMSYRGPKASDYAGVNKAEEKITHNGIYLGNGKILHTYSQESSGVRIDTLEGHWDYRFLFGGSAL